jgi:hypothetical protein
MEDRERRTKNGIIISIGSKDNKVCGSDRCTDRQVLLINGMCKTCNRYLVPNKQGRRCVMPDCESDLEIVNEIG